MSTSIRVVNSNNNIQTGATLRYYSPGMSASNFYSFSVNTTKPGTLTVISGWYDNGDNAGPYCEVTNEGQDTTFNLVRLTVGDETSNEVESILIS